MIRGAIIDLDGTLADTATIHGEAWRRALNDLGIREEVSVEALLGKRAPEIASILAHGNEELAHRLLERKNIHFLNLVNRARPKECSYELLGLLKRLGIKTAVVTSSNSVSAYSVLKALNMIEQVDVVVTGDDVSKGKPDPEPILKSLRMLNLKPSEVIGIGDTIHDYNAYVSSGIRLIFIIYGPYTSGLIERMAEAIVVRNLCQLVSILDMRCL